MSRNFFAGSGFMGIVAPSTLYGVRDGVMYINGPAGVVKVTTQGEAAMLDALRTAEALIPGSEQAVYEVNRLLEDPRSSRTVSFLLCGAASCEDVIDDIAQIQKARILMFGNGGIGSTTSMLLAGSGINHLTISDGDIIEESNLNRQLFWRRSDIGMHKVEVLQKILLEKFPEISVNTIIRNCSLSEIERVLNDKYDALVVTADEPISLGFDCEILANRHAIPVVSAGYLHRHCITNFFVSTPAIEGTDLAKKQSMDWKRLPGAIMPSFGPSNFALASLLASSVIAHLAKKTLGASKAHKIIWDANSPPLKFDTVMG
jgi:hypothetical protein